MQRHYSFKTSYDPEPTSYAAKQRQSKVVVPRAGSKDAIRGNSKNSVNQAQQKNQSANASRRVSAGTQLNQPVHQTGTKIISINLNDGNQKNRQGSVEGGSSSVESKKSFQANYQANSSMQPTQHDISNDIIATSFSVEADFHNQSDVERDKETTQSSTSLYSKFNRIIQSAKILSNAGLNQSTTNRKRNTLITKQASNQVLRSKASSNQPQTQTVGSQERNKSYERRNFSSYLGSPNTNQNMYYQDGVFSPSTRQSTLAKQISSALVQKNKQSREFRNHVNNDDQISNSQNRTRPQKPHTNLYKNAALKSATSSHNSSAITEKQRALNQNSQILSSNSRTDVISGVIVTETGTQAIPSKSISNLMSPISGVGDAFDFRGSAIQERNKSDLKGGNLRQRLQYLSAQQMEQLVNESQQTVEIRWKQFVELNREIYSKRDVKRIINKLQDVILMAQLKFREANVMKIEADERLGTVEIELDLQRKEVDRFRQQVRAVDQLVQQVQEDSKGLIDQMNQCNQYLRQTMIHSGQVLSFLKNIDESKICIADKQDILEMIESNKLRSTADNDVEGISDLMQKNDDSILFFNNLHTKFQVKSKEIFEANQQFDDKGNEIKTQSTLSLISQHLKKKNKNPPQQQPSNSDVAQLDLREYNEISLLKELTENKQNLKKQTEAVSSLKFKLVTAEKRIEELVRKQRNPIASALVTESAKDKDLKKQKKMVLEKDIKIGELEKFLDEKQMKVDYLEELLVRKNVNAPMIIEQLTPRTLASALSPVQDMGLMTEVTGELLEETEAQLSDLDNEVSQLRDENTKLKEQLQYYAQKYEALQSDYSNIFSQNQDKQSQLQKLQSQYNLLETEIKSDSKFQMLEQTFSQMSLMLVNKMNTSESISQYQQQLISLLFGQQQAIPNLVKKDCETEKPSLGGQINADRIKEQIEAIREGNLKKIKIARRENKKLKKFAQAHLNSFLNIMRKCQDPIAEILGQTQYDDEISIIEKALTNLHLKKLPKSIKLSHSPSDMIMNKSRLLSFSEGLSSPSMKLFQFGDRRSGDGDEIDASAEVISSISDNHTIDFNDELAHLRAMVKEKDDEIKILKSQQDLIHDLKQF